MFNSSRTFLHLAISTLWISLTVPLAAYSYDAAPSTATKQDTLNNVVWDVANPPLKTRQISINVSSGTWMSVDVSPDGSMLVFDLLGDIYTMPIDGGKATNISSGLPWEIQPRFSHDGNKIAFVSDRNGGNNIWIMNVDGSERRAITSENFRLLSNPSWSPDGRYIVARKHFTTARSLGTGEIWLYHVLGGNGVPLVKRDSEDFQKEQGEPTFSPDGNHVYFVKNITPGNQFIYAQDSNKDLFNILRYDMQNGAIDTAVSGYGGAVRPTPSPDGRYLAFVRRDNIRSNLYVKDLVSGELQMIYEGLDQDLQETWGVLGMYPNMDWTPDSDAIVFWAKGGIHKVQIASKQVSQIPFLIEDARDVIDPPRPNAAVSPDRFTTKMPRFASVAPDGSRVVFESLGQLWIQNTNGGEAKRLTPSKSTRRELFPAWSRDSKSIVYATWDDQQLGSIYTISASGGREKKLTQEPGHYRRPRFSPDGKSVVYEKGQGGGLLSPSWSEAPGIYRIASRGGQATRVSKSGTSPHYAGSNDRIFFTRYPGKDKTAELVSTNLSGQQERVHASAKLITEYQVSPDGTHLAFQENYDVFVSPMLPGPQMVATGIGSSSLPVTEVSGNGGAYMHWSHNGENINWSLGDTIFTAPIASINVRPNSNNSQKDGEQKTFAPPKGGLKIAMTITADKPRGLLALTNARIVSMIDENGGVIENGSILIEDNRIVAVGNTIDIPSSAQIVDLTGKTITPGFVDAHAHGPQGSDDIIPQQNWSAIAHLAMGVTTIHDPSSIASEIFAAGEYQRAGRHLAPRIYSTGEIVYGAKARGYYASIDSFGDARQHVQRLVEQGAHSIKNYNQPRRDQRQQVVTAAHQANIAVVAEGGSEYHMDMALIADGNTSIEHNLPQSMIYEDVLSLFSQTQVAYTPTLGATFGGLAADPYWRQHTDVWRHPILSKHVPPRMLRAQTVRRTKAPEDNFVDAVSARNALKLKKRGVMVSIGAHGQQQGLAAHWEMWSFVRGGFSPIEALAAATIVPARHLGFDQDLGSLEQGKLADLVILNSNPIDDINNTDDIDMVMLNGRLYQAETMNEVHTGEKKRAPYYWER